jgi:glycerol-3-phosphate dehydrogenase
MNRSEQLQRLRTETFDILIIGGGASGAGCALDSVTRGYKTALIEKADFAAGTSSRSTKLIHGGVRYLEQAFTKLDFAQLAQVRHGMQERYNVLKNAPHLARPQALVTPVFSWFEGLYYTIGLKIYSWFASKLDTLPPSKWLSKAQLKTRMPHLSQELHSAVLYYDGQLDDARYCLGLAHTAAEKGAAVANHVELLNFEKDARGKLTAALVRDTRSGESWRIEAKVFLNCTGPLADYVRLMANESLSKRMRPSKGVHAMLPHDVLDSQDALLIPETSDGRVVFAIPFQGKLMLGTTDEAYDELEKEPTLTEDEIDFLLETLSRYLDQPVDRSKVVAGFGGLRPLIASDPSKGTKGLVRDHEVEYDQQSGLVSLLGGKWTTYRVMAEDTIDYIGEELFGESRPCQTRDQHLIGGDHYEAHAWQQLQAAAELPEASARYLNQHYGDQAAHVLTVLAEAPRYREPLVAGYPYLQGEVAYAARHEMAVTVRDFLARRLRLEILDWEAAQLAAPIVAEILGQEYDWDTHQQEREAETYIDLIYEFREDAQRVN